MDFLFINQTQAQSLFFKLLSFLFLPTREEIRADIITNESIRTVNPVYLALLPE